MDYTVTVKIPMYVTKEIYVNNATNKTDARKKARNFIANGWDGYDFSGDSNDEHYNWYKATIKDVKENK